MLPLEPFLQRTAVGDRCCVVASCPVGESSDVPLGAISPDQTSPHPIHLLDPSFFPHSPVFSERKVGSLEKGRVRGRRRMGMDADSGADEHMPVRDSIAQSQRLAFPGPLRSIFRVQFLVPRWWYLSHRAVSASTSRNMGGAVDQITEKTVDGLCRKTCT